MKTAAKRTQIYLPADLHQQVSSYAQRKRLPMAAVIRLSVRDFLDRHARLSKRAYDKDPVWRLVGAISSKDGDLSRCHDYYLYGRPKTSCR